MRIVEIQILLFAFGFSYSVWAQEGGDAPISYGSRTTGFAAAIESVKKIEAECIQVIDEIKEEVVIKADGTPPYVLLGRRELEAIYFVESIRSNKAAQKLIRFLGLALIEKKADSQKITFEKTADHALQSIGLPSVDAIVHGVQDATIKEDKYNVAWSVLKDICGKETVIERVKRLGFQENPKIIAFLKDR